MYGVLAGAGMSASRGLLLKPEANKCLRVHNSMRSHGGCMLWMHGRFVGEQGLGVYSWTEAHSKHMARRRPPLPLTVCFFSLMDIVDDERTRGTSLVVVTPWFGANPWLSFFQFYVAHSPFVHMGFVFRCCVSMFMLCFYFH